jgi:hypothetical protein
MIARVAQAIIVTLVTVTASTVPLRAAPQDYRFEGIETIVSPGQPQHVTVKLLHVATNAPVAGATVVRSELYMPMNGMAAMHGTASAQRIDRPGLLAFVVNVPMAGDWLLDITAKLAEEPKPLRGTVALYVDMQDEQATKHALVPECIEDRPSLYEDC